MSENKNFVPYHHLAREWDARFNLPTPEDVQLLIGAAQSEALDGKFRYALIGGVEVGDRPYQNDFNIRHVHRALVYNNRVSKSCVLKNLGIKQGHGYYLVPRRQELPYSGWKEHHTKVKAKEDPESLLLFEYGNLPQDKPNTSANITKRSEQEKKRPLDDIIMEMRKDIEDGNDEEAFRKFPRNYLTYGEKIKALISQRRNFFKSDGHPHIWLTGSPGSGKSAILQVVYPNYYNKNLDNRFFDLYKPDVHTHMLLQDVDHNTVEKLGVQFLKTI